MVHSGPVRPRPGVRPCPSTIPPVSASTASRFGPSTGWGRVLHSDAGAGQAAPGRGRLARAAGRPVVLAVVQSGHAARRRRTPMKVRPTDPRRAPCRPYGLGRVGEGVRIEREKQKTKGTHPILFGSIIALRRQRGKGIVGTGGGREERPGRRRPCLPVICRLVRSLILPGA